MVTPAPIWTSPEYFPLRVIPRENKLVLVRVSERRYQEVNFLDDRELPLTAALELALDETLQQFEAMQLPRRSLHGIFHIAFCGSTLIARCLDQLPHAMVLKEPLCLHEMAHEKRRASSADLATQAWQRRFELVTWLLGRSFHAGQLVVAKTTDASTNLLGDLLARTAGSRALFLYVGLEEFLAALLGDESRMGFVRDRLDDLCVLFPHESAFQRERRFGLSDAEQAACLWMLHMHLHAELVRADPQGRCRSLDFAAFLRDPARALSAIARHLGMAASAPALTRAVASQMQVHSKNAQRSFTPEQRAQRLLWLSTKHREEIRVARAAAERYLAHAGLSWDAPSPLELD